MSMSNFPVELLEIILANLYSTDLAACHLVCRKWHMTIGLKPFKNVDFDTEKSLVKFTTYIQKSHYNSSFYGSLVKKIHFNLYQISSTHTFATFVRFLIQYCKNIHTITSNSVIDNVVLQALNSLPSDLQLNRLRRIPIVGYDVYYGLCAQKFRQSITQLDLRNPDLNREAVLNHAFPKLKELSLGAMVNPLATISSILNTSTQLSYLKFELKQSPPVSRLPTKEHSSVCELEISSKVTNGFDHAELNKFLFSFINTDKLTISMFDSVDSSQPPDQIDAVRDFMYWVNALEDGRLCIKNLRPENLLTYLKYIFNTIPHEREDWKTKLVFLHPSLYADPVISYSTHTGYRERTFGIMLDNSFAKNLICSYLNRLCLPYTVHLQ
ncbi:hypothetical protein [Parasitella parasitica]|uniref:F-box domain-containing protein n=1 Tax=Parasitella parasitica TaxID=35722 RepID=A0A0B7NCX7_9FUNG|nr:hypothetical protein [Parasitella parasitica]